MRVLLDTHALLWWWVDDPRLSGRAREVVADRSVQVFVSAASAWEIATKVRLGKLPEAEGAVFRWRDLVAADGFCSLSVRDEHGLRAGTYPAAHRDPFDRILAAQAELDELSLVTMDAAFASFPVRTLW